MASGDYAPGDSFIHATAFDDAAVIAKVRDFAGSAMDQRKLDG